MIENPLKKLVEMQKSGKKVGIYSACSANEYVIEAVLKRGKEEDSCVLIESTANQCDQNGGYTGMTPMDFKNFVFRVAKKIGFNIDNIFLGGDHLGPLTWSYLNEKEAMENAKTLIEEYVKAGFKKIHIDTSMRLKDDDINVSLSDDIIVKRGVYLAKVAENEYRKMLKKNPDETQIVYVVGSEVPIPGGSMDGNDKLQITKVESLKNTIEKYKEEFYKEGLGKAFDNVIAVVVQPGVEENENGCVPYNREKAKELMNEIKNYKSLVFEGHSTDYQTKFELKNLIEDGVAILKVGPALTFAMREALFALEKIEKEMFCIDDIKPSNFEYILEKEMLKDKKYWQNHCKGNDLEIQFKRKFSFSDRARYYMPNKRVEDARKILINNLRENEIPLGLISQYMPVQYTKIREGNLDKDPESLIIDRIINVIDEYLYATNQKELIRTKDV